jgi:hypothetical protein
MKTYEDLRTEVMERDFETPVSHAQIEELAAKEYAKQWVKYALESSHEAYKTALVEDVHKEIDAQ